MQNSLNHSNHHTYHNDRGQDNEIARETLILPPHQDQILSQQANDPVEVIMIPELPAVDAVVNIIEVRIDTPTEVQTSNQNIAPSQSVNPSLAHMRFV